MGAFSGPLHPLIGTCTGDRQTSPGGVPASTEHIAGSGGRSGSHRVVPISQLAEVARLRGRKSQSFLVGVYPVPRIDMMRLWGNP